MRVILVMTIMVASGLGNAALYAQSWQMPPDEQRCPSRWGGRRPARFRQLDEARNGPARGKTDTNRRGV